MKVIELYKYKALKQLQEILPLPSSTTSSIVEHMYSGQSLAQALRAVDIRSSKEIHPHLWVELREWRDEFFPNGS